MGSKSRLSNIKFILYPVSMRNTSWSFFGKDLYDLRNKLLSLLYQIFLVSLYISLYICPKILNDIEVWALGHFNVLMLLVFTHSFTILDMWPVLILSGLLVMYKGSINAKMYLIFLPYSSKTTYLLIILTPALAFLMYSLPSLLTKISDTSLNSIFSKIEEHIFSKFNFIFWFFTEKCFGWNWY